MYVYLNWTLLEKLFITAKTFLFSLTDMLQSNFSLFDSLNVWYFHSLHNLSSALRDYTYKVSHNDTIDYTTHCEYH